jgi:hypothetical protein
MTTADTGMVLTDKRAACRKPTPLRTRDLDVPSLMEDRISLPDAAPGQPMAERPRDELSGPGAPGPGEHRCDFDGAAARVGRAAQAEYPPRNTRNDERARASNARQPPASPAAVEQGGFLLRRAVLTMIVNRDGEEGNKLRGFAP